MRKLCNSCNKVKDKDKDFRSYFCTNRGKMQFRGICKNCESEYRKDKQYSKKYYKANKEKVKLICNKGEIRVVSREVVD